MIRVIPELATKFFVAVSDKEFPDILKKHFKKAFIAADEIHVGKDIERSVLELFWTGNAYSIYCRPIKMEIISITICMWFL